MKFCFIFWSVGSLPRGETFCISAGFGTTIAQGWGHSRNKGFSMSIRSGTGSYLHLGGSQNKGPKISQ